MSLRLLLVDDEPPVAEAVAGVVRTAGHVVEIETSPRRALDRLAAEPFDLLLTDVRMPEIDGMSLWVRARSVRPEIDGVIMTAYGSIPAAVEAVKSGASAYLTKPLDFDELLAHLARIEERRLLLSALVAGREASRRAGRGALVGTSDVMNAVYEAIDRAAASDLPVLLIGETGTGKELAARAIHDLSRRHGRPFVAVNIAALPSDLAESELFGAEKGAYTGAQNRRRGRFILAAGGTLFLDEIDSLSVSVQPKILRAIEEGEVWPLGAERPVKADARIVAATHRDLAALVAEGRFREDLRYRLHVLEVRLPPLREHAEDIPLLVRTLLERNRAGRISPEAIAVLAGRPWPGNVRELENVLLRAAQAASGGVIGPEHLDPGAGPDVPARLPYREAKRKAMAEWDRKAISAALAETEGNVSEAARRLGMRRTTLQALMKRYGLSRPAPSGGTAAGPG